MPSQGPSTPSPVEDACTAAFADGVFGNCVVLNILSRCHPVTAPVDVTTPDALRLHYSPRADHAHNDTAHRLHCDHGPSDRFSSVRPVFPELPIWHGTAKRRSLGSTVLSRAIAP
jgi:hypothetical protein